MAMRICIAGKNRIAVEVLRYLLVKYPLIEIFVAPNESDNGTDNLFQTSLKRAAIERGLSVIDVTTASRMRFNIFLSLECDKVLDISTFNSALLVNLHFSFLPFYRGVYTSAWPILNGERRSGVTLHIIDAGIDTGPIIARSSFDLDFDETAYCLYEKYQSYGLILIVENIEKLVDGSFEKTLQESGGSYYSKKSIDYKNLKIDFNVSADALSRQLRAYYFPYYQVPAIGGIKVRAPRISNVQSRLQPGSYTLEGDQKIIISTRTTDVVCDVIL